jgi:phosphoribosyl 1,2-cyclic phosphate phosphodiesterase
MSGYLRATILGSGSSGGVPRSNGDWGDCDPFNPKNRRRRCSLLVEKASSQKIMDLGEDVTRVIVDIAPDFREQMLSAHVTHIHGVLISHDHADQTSGMDDLRAFAMAQRERIPVWMNDETASTLLIRFGYAFNKKPGSYYPAILNKCDLNDYEKPVGFEGPGGVITVRAFDQAHGPIRSLGYRFDDIAYSADINELPDASLNALKGVKCWIVDALRETPRPTHFSVSDALGAIERVQIPQGVLTNLHITLDHDVLSAKLPDHVCCAHDGMRVASDGVTITIEDNCL